jgi:imidazolonepropionase-like amidohydrolase
VKPGLVLLTLGVLAIPLQGEAQEPVRALVGATLIDGTGAPPTPDAVVVVEEGRIVCAGDREACPLDDEVPVVDLSGHWILPGLVDAHVHFSQSGWADGRPDALDVRDRHPYSATVARLRDNPDTFFRSYLCSGVTTVFDVGGYPWSWALRDRGPRFTHSVRVAAAGPLLSTRDHWVNLPAEQQFLHLADRDATREAADYLVTQGTDAVKVWYLRAPEAADRARHREYLELAGRWARTWNVPLIVHATNLEGAKEALRAGARLLVHSVEDELVDEEFLELARRAGAAYTPTLAVYEGYAELRERRFDEDRTDVECVDPHTLELARSTRDLPGAPSAADAQIARERARERDERTRENLLRVHRAGIPVAMGTDAGNPLTLHGPAVFREMEAMHEAGLSPMDVLVASTMGGARAMGLEAEVGSVEPGKAADLTIVAGDPLQDLANLRQVRLVVRGGELFTREELAWTHDD